MSLQTHTVFNFIFLLFDIKGLRILSTLKWCKHYSRTIQHLSTGKKKSKKNPNKQKKQPQKTRDLGT